MKKIINAVMLTIASAGFISGCNSGGSGNTNSAVEGTETMNMTVKKVSNTLPATAKKLSGPQFTYVDMISNNVYRRESSNGYYVTIPVSGEIKYDLESQPKERLDYDYDEITGARTAIIYGDENYLNTRKIYILSSSDGGKVWSTTHSFTPTNLVANPVHSEGVLYSSTATSNLVAIQSDGTQTALLGNDCDGSATTSLKRVHSTKDVNNLYSNILIATKKGGVCLYDVKSHKLDKLVAGNGIAITQVAVDVLGSMFAYVSSDGVLRINKINGENIATYNQNNFDYAYNPSHIVFTPNRDLAITKLYNVGGNKFFSTAKWKFKKHHLTAAKYHTFDGEVYNYIPTNSLSSGVSVLSFWGDFAAIAVDVVTVAVSVAAVVVAPEAAPEIVEADIDVVDVERSASSAQLLWDALDLQF